MIKWVYKQLGNHRGPETPAGRFLAFPDTARYPPEAEAIVRSDGLA
jgi:hypothetical protein